LIRRDIGGGEGRGVANGSAGSGWGVFGVVIMLAPPPPPPPYPDSVAKVL